MISNLKLSVSAAALALLVTAGAGSSVKAADVVAEPGCTLSGSVMAGYMFDWQKDKEDFSIHVPGEGNIDIFSEDNDVDWETPFGEGAGLVTCGGFNIQADVAYYAHSADTDNSDVDLDQTNTHIGGAVFFRDPASWAGGLSASWISQDVLGKDLDVFRVGLFGEFYLDDMFTFGGSAHYYNADGYEEDFKDEDGFELAAWGRFYVTPDLSLMARGDFLIANPDFANFTPFDSDDTTGWAITGEGEYLVWDQGLSLFAGARYAERDAEVDIDVGQGAEERFKFDVDDFQVYAGIKFYFGQDGTLVERQRTGTVDNTSVWNEKLPNIFTSLEASDVLIP
jgi:hypothetical protein